LVQPKDDVPYTFPTILNPKVVLQVPKIDEDLDIRVHHDLVELSMMEAFQQVFILYQLILEGEKVC
jgi:hypothetical protein